MRNLFVSLPILAATLAAQNYVVSPAYCVNAEGGTNNTIPFWSGYYRYQQPTSDLKGVVRTLTEIAWRRDGSFGSTARTIDLEIALGDTDIPTFTTTFATNYVNPGITVFTRKLANLPDTSVQPASSPAPWSFALPFDVPFVSIGAKDLLYDVTSYTWTSTASYPLDSVTGLTPSATGGFAANGTGCTTSNGLMTLRSTFTISSAANSLSLVWNLTRGPATASTAFFIGLVDPALPIPNLCGDGLLHTDASLFTISGTTAANGTLSTTAIPLAPYNPAWQAISLSAQAASLDASQGAFPVAVSNGVLSSVPQMPTPTSGHRLYATTVAATVGSITLNYGLVTRFRY